MNRTRFTGLPALVLAAALSGCADDRLTTPVPAAADPATVPFARVALQDALDRIVPGLSQGPATAEMRSALVALLSDPSSASLRGMEAALERVAVEQPDAAPEVDAIRLAISASH